jgi:hypothetical protein
LFQLEKGDCGFCTHIPVKYLIDEIMEHVLHEALLD